MYMEDLLKPITLEHKYRCPWCGRTAIGKTPDEAKAHVLGCLLQELQADRENIKVLGGWVAHILPDPLLRRLLEEHASQKYRELTHLT